MKEVSKSSGMNSANNTLTRKRVLVTITPYNEQEKRVLNGSASSVPPAPAPPAPPLPLPSKTKGTEDSVEMQSIESFKLKESPSPVVPKPPATYFPITSATTATSGSPRHQSTGNKPQINGKDQTSPLCPTSEGANKSAIVSPTNGNAVNGKIGSGKVAIRIGAYEGEAKQPSKLEFLSQQSRNIEKNGGEELSNGPVVSRLQNELAATLQRSNLRKKTEGDNQSAIKPIPETPNNETNSCAGKPEPGKLQASTVEKLASALGNKVTIKVNPENGSR